MNLPDSSRFYPSRVAGEVRKVLGRLFLHGNGIGLLVGAAGVGKTLLLHVLRQELESRFDVVLLNGTMLRSANDLLIQLAQSLELATCDIASVRRSLNESLADCGTKQVLLLIDESQNAVADVFYEVAAMSELVGSKNGEMCASVRVLLAGTPAIEETLSAAGFESLNQRIARRCYLEAMGTLECREFIQTEIKSVRLPITTENFCELFDSAAYKEIAKLTNGIPRLINQLADVSLQTAMELELHQVSSDVVKNAWSKIQSFRDSTSRNVELSDVANDEDIDEADERDEPELFGMSVSMTDIPTATSFDDCDDSELASFDIDCTCETSEVTSATEIVTNEIDTVDEQINVTIDGIVDIVEDKDNNGKAAASDNVTEPGCPTEYVYQSHCVPFVPQYPCYINKNITMMNWVAPGHNVPSGIATPYNEKNFTSDSKQTVSRKQTRAASIAVTSQGTTMPERQTIYANFSTDNHEKPRSIGAVGCSTIDEHFDEVERVPFETVPFSQHPLPTKRLMLPMVGRRGNDSSGETAIAEMRRAAERIEVVTNRLEQIGGEVGSTLQLVETGVAEIQQTIEQQTLPTCRELIAEFTKLHQVVADELRRTETEKKQPLTLKHNFQPKREHTNRLNDIAENAKRQSVGLFCQAAAGGDSVISTIVRKSNLHSPLTLQQTIPQEVPTRKTVEFRPQSR
ncbi:MAG: ATP-binding protein [Planctomycetaceae bacterium]|nr:ATP-binding protein [Planctomycetaceae bacterium]